MSCRRSDEFWIQIGSVQINRKRRHDLIEDRNAEDAIPDSSAGNSSQFKMPCIPHSDSLYPTPVCSPVSSPFSLPGFSSNIPAFSSQVTSSFSTQVASPITPSFPSYNYSPFYTPIASPLSPPVTPTFNSPFCNITATLPPSEPAAPSHPSPFDASIPSTSFSNPYSYVSPFSTYHEPFMDHHLPFPQVPVFYESEYDALPSQISENEFINIYYECIHKLENLDLNSDFTSYCTPD